MADFFHRINEIFDEQKLELSTLFTISLGIFLFILFFNPFGLIKSDLNIQLLVILGLGAIIFLMMTVIYVVLPNALPKLYKPDAFPEEPQYLLGLVCWVFCSVAFTFYLRYVGNVGITFYLVFKALIVCLAPVIIYRIVQIRIILNHQLFLSNKIIERLQETLSGKPDDLRHEKIVIESENKSENLEVKVSEIVLIRSADNYIEVDYLEKGELKRRLLRSTLKNAEEQLARIPDFLRCHRTTLINTGYIEKLYRSYSGIYLRIKGIESDIPVSRQYLLKVKEKLKPVPVPASEG